MYQLASARVPKVGGNHRPAIKVFHDFTEKFNCCRRRAFRKRSGRSGSLALGLPSLRMGICYAMLCYLPHECLLGRSAGGYCAYLGPCILNTFHSDVHAFFIGSGFLGTSMLWDNPFSGQGQDLSSFGLTKMHTTDRRYVAHKASLYSTLQSSFRTLFFSGCQLIPDLNRLYCSRNCGHAPALQKRQIRVIRRLTTTLSHISPQKKLSTGSPSPRATCNEHPWKDQTPHEENTAR